MCLMACRNCHRIEGVLLLPFIAAKVSNQHDTLIHFALFVNDKVLNLSHFAELQKLVGKISWGSLRGYDSLR